MRVDPLGPYRSAPKAAERPAPVPPARWFGIGVGALSALVLGAWLAPGVTAATVGALLFYVAAPWFVMRAPGP